MRSDAVIHCQIPEMAFLCTGRPSSPRIPQKLSFARREIGEDSNSKSQHKQVKHNECVCDGSSPAMRGKPSQVGITAFSLSALQAGSLQSRETCNNVTCYYISNYGNANSSDYINMGVRKLIQINNKKRRRGAHPHTYKHTTLTAKQTAEFHNNCSQSVDLSRTVTGNINKNKQYFYYYYSYYAYIGYQCRKMIQFYQ